MTTHDAISHWLDAEPRGGAVSGGVVRPSGLRRASTAGRAGRDHDGARARRVRVLAVDDDDDELVALVRLTLKLTQRFELVGEAADGASAIALSAQLRPDVVVLDLGLPDLHVLAEICRVSPQTRVVVFSGLDEAVVRSAALSGSAASYVLKGSDTAALLRAVESASPTAHKKASAIFTAAPQSASAARRFVGDACARWDCDDLADEATLVTSELVTNAIVHAQSHLRLTISLRHGVLRVEVWDNAAEAPNPSAVAADSEQGRGLFLVAAVSCAWGVDQFDNGKMVWAELASSVRSGSPQR